MHYNFLKTAEINRLVGNHPNPTDYVGLLRQLDLIESEIKEGESHVANLAENPEALRDDILDILFTTYGLASRWGCTVSDIDLAPYLGIRPCTNFEAARHAEVPTDPDTLPGEAQHTLTQARNYVAVMRERIAVVSDTDEQFDPAIAVFFKPMLLDVYTLGVQCDYPVDDDYRLLVASNYAKFDLTPEDAELTRQKYATKGIETTLYVADGEDGVTYYITKSSKTQQDLNGETIKEGKWLKSHRWQEPVYPPLPALASV